MTITKIRLIGDFFNVGINDYLEVAENVVVPLNFGVSDIRDLAMKTGSFSKSIKIAGTKHNNVVLGHIFDVNNVSLTFNINNKQKCLIEQDGEVVLDNAIMQLISVEKVSTGTGYDEILDYTITVKDTVSELFTEIGNKLLTDLDFSDLNHIYEASAVISSYNHQKEQGYKYILPMTDDNIYNLIEMKPAIYVWQYFKRIFAKAGYSYQFDEMQAIGFDKLLIPYNGGKSKLSEAGLNDIQVVAQQTAYQDITFSAAGGIGLININTEIIDANNYYDPATSQYTNPFHLTAPAQVQYEVDIDYTLYINNGSGYPITPINVFAYKINLVLAKNPFSILTPILASTPLIFTYVNPVYTINSEGEVLIENGTNVPAGQSLLASGVNKFTMSSPASVGDELSLYSKYNVSETMSDYYAIPSELLVSYPSLQLRINSIKIRIVPSAESLTYLMPVKMNDFVPAKIKQGDFLKSLFTMFNLFVIPNEDNPKDIIIQTRDSFYDSGGVKDFSKKLCKNLPQTITFLPELTAKKITLTYAVDTDTLNVGYKKNVNETYGQTQYVFDNQYIKNEEIKGVLFGASPFVTSPFGATVMAINGSEPKTLPRIVFDGGVFTCGYYQINNTQSTFVSVNQYPFVGHFSAPFNADKDLNFGTCDYYFENNYGVIPNNNLGNTYWRRTMAQINSGSLYSVFLNVNSFDVANLKLNDKIYLDRSYYIINKVIDYDANSNGPTKFELLSFEQEIKLPIFKITKPNRPSKHDAGVSVPIKDLIKMRYNSLTADSSTGGVLLLGKGNQVLGTVKNAIVIGDNRIINKDGIYTSNLFIGTAEILSPKYLFKALVSQVGMANPTMNVAVDQFGLTITRTGVGVYHLTSPNAVFLGQVLCLAQFSSLTVGFISIGKKSLFQVEITTLNALGGVTDGILANTTIIIESWQKK